VWAALAKGLQPRPELRFPDMESLLAVLSLTAVDAPPRRRRVPAYAAAVVLGLGLAIGVGAVGLRGKIPMLRAAPVAPPLPNLIELSQGATQSFAVPGVSSVNASGAAITGTSLTNDTLSVTGGAPGQGTLHVAMRDGRHIAAMVQVPAPPGSLPAKITLEERAVQKVHLPGITRIAVGETDIANVEGEGDDVYVTAGHVGKTSLMIWTGTRRHESEISVIAGQSVDANGTVELAPGLQKILDVPGIQRIAVGDASIADVKTIGDDEILLIGMDPGRTTLLVWTEKGRRSYTVHVAPPAPIVLKVGETRDLPFDDIAKCWITGMNVATISCKGGHALHIEAHAAGHARVRLWKRDGSQEAIGLQIEP
jgi:hypothetical protein